MKRFARQNLLAWLFPRSVQRTESRLRSRCPSPWHLDRKTPWRLVKKYCQAAGIDPHRLGQRGIGIHSLRKTAINDAIRNGAQMHEVREFAGHSDIRTTELYFVRKEEDGEVAARRIQIRVARTKDRGS
ncbi:MAG TPA: site-specific integrase [Gemmataceae bacterium]|nr:site-specific integrase [Gemmataceae bacterium]